MRPIGNLSDETQAQLFSDYLFAQGIANQVEHDSETTWSVWVEDEDQLAPARAKLDQFRAAPNAPEFQRDAAKAGRIRDEQAKADAEYRKRTFTRQRIFPSFGGYGVGVLTYALIIGSVLVAILSQMGADKLFLRHLFIEDPFVGGRMLAEVRDGQVWRLITPIFIHFGPLHLIFNMLWLFQLGCMIEARRGTAAFATLVFAVSAVSNLAQLYVGSPTFGGMSGVVYGLFGYVWIRGKYDRGSGLFIDERSTVIMIAWFFICLTGLLGPVANACHAVGLVMGMAWGGMTAWRANRNPR